MSERIKIRLRKTQCNKNMSNAIFVAVLLLLLLFFFSGNK